ncbi:AlpA family phage regulatory protein [Marinicella sp. S1101]|uniref:helix-turn-helix transcriptional regulator n=1 Tax=Marinicella marina TaxID=2996016 RepID=UPI002260D4D5|nr:AlpA family phage regulatory protein [Marinicella marina]MCX7553123.1 AlpA family phage regulatory protein [Marinicella marina]MDJ1138855.1 AlpA family phage regulatory protein [Marinicella marina]
MKFEKLIKLPEVIETTGKSRSSIYDGMKQGTFPKNIPIGVKARAWKLSDIQQWIENQSREVSQCQ